MPITIIRTTSANAHFIQLVKLLDADLAIRNGDQNDFFTPHNKIDHIQHVVIAFNDDEALGCGAMKKYDDTTVEIKRMYVLPAMRGKGVASSILSQLEQWACELGFQRCILETGDKMPEAIGLYKRSNYRIISNYGPYTNVASSICFEKLI